MNRREFVRSSAAGLSLVVLAPHALAAKLGAAVAPPITAAIYDERHPDARAFAAALQRGGVTPFPVRGDLIGLWYGDLGTLLRRQGGRVAGLTTYADFAIARSCGRELALRAIVEATHDARKSTHATHRHRAAAGSDMIPGYLTSWLLEPRLGLVSPNS